ncbi:PHP domain-containing protein [Paradesulfitobacterium ferrireducens]|uniref:PHP domain-containing protein n=1 Tax=Paradesulfitobacterium ferrireducens TaxID=2816476 RepID=UPI001A8F5BF7|nr:PHP domain-containing protein [Paradesulfitobacterium ferrireducens]
MKIDLHVHTEESDGVHSVEEIVKLALDNQVDVLALTDHETTQGVGKAQELVSASGSSLKIIPGVEFLTSYKGQEIHLLGYFANIENSLLQSRLKELRDFRTQLAFDMVKLLQQDGFALEWQKVEQEASSEGAVSKAHIMRVLYHMNKGLTGQKILSYFQPGGVAYLPFLKHPYEEAVDLVYSCQGLPVLAHPGLIRKQELVRELLAARTTGLEVYYGYWENRQTLMNHYEKVAKEKELIVTGGSDYHGPFSQVRIGDLPIPEAVVNNLEIYFKTKFI